jgi:very-short-patch-repair endonuclease
MPSTRARTAWLERQGFRVLRFWNNEVLGNIEDVHDVIVAHLAGGDVPPP